MTLDPAKSDAELLALVRQKRSTVANRLADVMRGVKRVRSGHVIGDDPASRFRWLCKASGLPIPTAEYRFHPARRWRFDWAWSEAKVALEVDGGNFIGGAHVRGTRIMKTHEKINSAASMGWRILYCVPKQLCTTETVELLRSALTPVTEQAS